MPSTDVVLQVVDHTLARVPASTALATSAACFFAWMFYKVCTRAISALQAENKRLVDEKKILYSKLGLNPEPSGLDHYTPTKKSKKKVKV